MHLIGIFRMKNIERVIDTESAINKAIECYKFLNIKYIVTEIKATEYISTYTVSLCEGKLQGNGKGIGKQSLASALFEGLEHYIYRQSSSEDYMRKICDLHYTSRNLEYPLIYLNDKVDGETEIAVSMFCDEKGGEFLYPTILWNVYSKTAWENKRLQPIYKYMTNSGCAMGVSKEEAVLHAINEIVERTSIAQHYRRVFLEKKKAIFIDPLSLPERLKEIFEKVEAEIKEKITIVKVEPAIDGIACYLVFAKRTGNVPLKGAGASISEEYACERALLECLQSYHLQCKETDEEDKMAQAAFKNLPLYSSILNLNYMNYKYIEFPIKKKEEITFANVILDVREKLHKAGIVYYTKCLFSYAGIYCMQVIMPEFVDKFYLVGDGIPVIPKGVVK